MSRILPIKSLPFAKRRSYRDPCCLIRSNRSAFRGALSSSSRNFCSSSTNRLAIAGGEPSQSSPQILHHLSPKPDDYSRSLFVDKCILTVQAGTGGNGCVSFFRDKHISDGPPNGGDGGTGGNVWIQAIKGHTSLYKLARRRAVKAGRGISGQGGSKGGAKGSDALIQIPIGTVVREISRSDPSLEDDGPEKLTLGTGNSVSFNTLEHDTSTAAKRGKWVYYQGAKTERDTRLAMPPLLKPRKSPYAMMAPPAPVELDLSDHMEKPTLLAAGGVGGLGNPHFATSDVPKPKFASKGELGVKLILELELKLLADVGLVGLPNAGKSTLLRSMSNSRTRVGYWAFTTLSPSIGTVVLDNHEGRPMLTSRIEGGQGSRTHFTVADIPGLIEDAHLNKGLGLGFLRHIERARILAFVIDLSAGDAILALNNLWKEVGEYESLRNKELNEDTEGRMVKWSGFEGARASPMLNDESDGEEGMIIHPEPARVLEPLKLPPISSKPWFVVATKADKTETQNNFTSLLAHLQDVEAGKIEHPSGRKNGWRNRIAVIPVSALHGEGVGKIAEWVAGLLDGT